MLFSNYKYLVLSDLYRISGELNKKIFFRELIKNDSFKFTFWFRTSNFLQHKFFLKILLYPISRFILKHYTYKYGISIPYSTKIDSGFYIVHFGGIVINSNCIIGKNVNISHGVTLGQANRDKYKGVPTIGDNVYIGPGSKIIGAIKIGNNVSIGANAVVTKDIPDNSVVVGIPAKIISQAGSIGYINRIDYEDKIIKKDKR